MQIKRSIIYIILTCFCAGVFLAACKKDEVEEQVRLFRPVLKGDLESGGNWIEVNWQSIKGAKTYTIQISKDTFKTVFQSAQVDTNGHLFQNLDFETLYQLQVKANAEDTVYNSKWSTLGAIKTPKFPSVLTIPLDADMTDKTVKVKWTNSGAALTSLKVLLASDNSLVKEVPLDGTDITNQFKIVAGLTAKTKYTISIYSGTALRGTESYTTKEPSLYTTVLKPGDDLVTAVANAANGDVIGLDPGSYNCVDATSTYTNLVISQKTISIVSTSGDPTKTKVNFKEITLKGTGAGVTLKGIEFDGSAGSAAYFLNLTGLTLDADAATFTDLVVDNCIVKTVANCFLRGNRANAGDHKVNLIKVSNTVASNSGVGSTYVFFTVDKLQFTKLELVKSTFHSMGRAFINCSATLSGAKPTILVDQCTINNFGSGGTSRNYTIFDANANPVDLTIQNSIIANTPMKDQTIGNAAIRASAATSVLLFTNNNTFNVTNGAATPAALTYPANLTMTSNKTVGLGWDGTTTNFSLPAGSELRTSSSSGGPIGDPRWAQ
ncbi:DUF4957 domain-containing protein [Paraflavitalea sp. CAU 1676]|uniref:DUF4957 domain-containing protein n=1 Tax=Paraflavitalea sp. CAU 1676 TaxID=3032598 RepID=UPI0023DC953C|nr:DUF4957 domain-containing protein [Paraflavitalea sp. CAU 1676]MDF2189557.1 DUF4957 domain-containing protein [Paraflavitalea sp. CAU 1676]